LRFGLEACRLSLGASVARLWCSDELVQYYVKQGWECETQREHVNVMCKSCGGVALSDDAINDILAGM
jgi:hypothetical protein